MKDGSNLKGNETVLFLHIPKAAGTTLHSIIHDVYPAENVYDIPLIDIEDFKKEFKNYPDCKKQNIKLLKGHMYYGLHELMPGPCTYITMLRDPVERVVSYYYYVRGLPGHHAHKAAIRMELGEFIINNSTIEVNNDQTRRISGMDQVYPETGEMLSLAKSNLREKFSVVGITERFDESLILLQETLGWKIKTYSRLNQTGSRPEVKNISSGTLKIIEDFNRMDIELYRYACGLFEERIAAFQPRFNRHLKRFRFSNSMYSKYNKVRVFLKKQLIRG